MKPTYDAIVVGLGAMGSAACFQLAQRGARVLGLDQYSPPHTHGSSHGDTRITRQAICEGEEYVPLVLRSHEIWREIERETGKSLLTVTGGLILGDVKNVGGMHGTQNVVLDTIRAAEAYDIPHEVLDIAALKERFPQFHYAGNETGYYEPGAGFLRPEACVETQLELARKYGADIHTNEKFLGYDNDGDSIIVRTDKGTYASAKLILSAGPWIGELLPRHADLFKVFRQVLYWFKTKGPIAEFEPGRFPIFMWDLGISEDIYGFPAVDGAEGGIKIAHEEYPVATTPEAVERYVSDDETRRMFELAVTRIPGLTPECLRAVSCLYTVTPDHRFVIDTLPDDPRVIVASPCSGHGFKHSAAVGQILAELATDGESEFDISKFSLKRFSRQRVLTIERF